MVEKGKISAQQFTVLVILYTLGSTVLVIPSTLATLADNNAWISSLVGLFTGLLIVFFFNRISKMFPNQTFIEANEKVLGKYLGKVTSVLFLIPVYIAASLILREMGDFFTTQVMVKTPIQAIHIFFMISILYGIRKGLEVFARAGEVFLPWVFILLSLLVLLLLPQVELNNIQPTMSDGLGPVLGAAFPLVGIPYLQLIVFLMILPNTNSVKKARKGFYIGTFIGGVILSIITMMCILVLGDDMTGRQIYPSYILGKKVSVGNFLERVEILVAISWVLTMFFKLTVNTYVLVLGVAQVLHLNDYKPLIFPMFFCLIVTSMLFSPDIIYFQHFLLRTWPPFAVTFFLILPLVIFVIGKVKAKVTKEPNKQG